MNLEFDENKNKFNKSKHGLSMERATEFEWETANYKVDDRKDYGEKRIIALGFIGKRLHVLIFTQRAGNYRIISLRKANRKEVKDYEKEKNR